MTGANIRNRHKNQCGKIESSTSVNNVVNVLTIGSVFLKEKAKQFLKSMELVGRIDY